MAIQADDNTIKKYIDELMKMHLEATLKKQNQKKIKSKLNKNKKLKNNLKNETKQKNYPKNDKKSEKNQIVNIKPAKTHKQISNSQINPNTKTSKSTKIKSEKPMHIPSNLDSFTMA